MKILIISGFYQRYLTDFYLKHPEFAKKTFSEQKAAFDLDSNVWADYWSNVLPPLGFEVMGISCNAEFMQRAWARENSLPSPDHIDLREIVLAQAKSFKPDVLWFNDWDEDLLQIIRSEAPAIRLVVGQVGSAIPRSNIWNQMDLVLSCAKESVENLRNLGIKAEHLHHAFDPRIIARVQDSNKQYDVTFAGQLIRFNQYHLQREYLLAQLVEQFQIEIFSPSADLDWKDDAISFVMTGLYGTVKVVKAAGISESVIKRIPILRRAAELSSLPLRPVNPFLKPFLRPPVFGLDMFQVLHESKISLNMHADSSPVYASNLRMFETTGVGTCLLTDWRENLPELFEPDKEVVVYKSPEECVEKVKWLLKYPVEREKIAKAGQARTLRDHTYSQRGLRLAEIIRHTLSR